MGGWAVYLYNPYYGSIDIDIVARSSERQSIEDHLVRAFSFRVIGGGDRTPRQLVKSTPQGTIAIDFATAREVGNFYGREETLPFTVAFEEPVMIRMDDGIIPVVSLPRLILMKMKAAWDRTGMLSARDFGNDFVSSEPYLRGKRLKDMTDILALIDARRHGRRIDVAYLGRAFGRYPFLHEVMRWMKNENDSLGNYPANPESRIQLIETFESATKRS